MRRLLLMAAFVAALFVTVFGSAGAMEPAKSRAVVSDAFGEMITTFAGKKLDAATAEAAMAQIIKKYADLRLVAENMLGRYWQAAPSEIKDKFPGLMQQFFVKTFARTAVDIPAALKLAVLSVEDRGAWQVVHTRIGEAGGDLSDVNWVVAESADARYVICDVSMDGIAVIAAQISDWTSVIRQYGGTLEGLFGPLQVITRGNEPSEATPPEDRRRHQR